MEPRLKKKIVRANEKIKKLVKITFSFVETSIFLQNCTKTFKNNCTRAPYMFRKFRSPTVIFKPSLFFYGKTNWGA